MTQVDPTPFAEQARVTTDINYVGTRRLQEQLQPLLTPKAHVVFVSSTMGERATASMSESLREQFLSPELTVKDLDGLVQNFVTTAQDGSHASKVWLVSLHPALHFGSHLLIHKRVVSGQTHSLFFVALDMYHGAFMGSRDSNGTAHLQSEICVAARDSVCPILRTVFFELSQTGT